MKYLKMREEELKNKVASDLFSNFDCTRIIGNVDFCVAVPQAPNALFEQESLLWAESKQGSSNIYHSIVQLILTIGKARTFDKYLPPAMLGALDGGQIAFIPYNEIHDVFYMNDFNWNVTPSDYTTKEFGLILGKVKQIIDTKALQFDYIKDDRELKTFIKQNFIVGRYGLTKTRIDKNNFIVIYNKWLQGVRPSISVNWDLVKKAGIIDGDFYLADLLSQDNTSLKDNLFVLLRHDYYELDRKLNDVGLFTSSRTEFNDKMVAHTKFWNKYERPPKEEYWDYIVERRDLLVPQDVRERKGSFFTPQIWVELSQKYLTDALGEDWQDEYYVWDCAAGTGNLLNGLTNKYNIWASTLDKQDVEVMHDRIKNGANLLEDHVFQFDFLNDDFDKLPKPLKAIIDDPEKRKKLVVYINPPYAEADNRRGDGRTGVAESKIHQKYAERMGYAKRELFVQFLTRIYIEIPGVWLADFSTLKNLQAPKFSEFRDFFKVRPISCFIVPAKSFDNVSGDFPIGFKIWNTRVTEAYNTSIRAQVYMEEKGEPKLVGEKTLFSYDNVKLINDWVKSFRNTNSPSIATIIGVGSDFQNQRLVRIDKPHMKVPASNHNWQITKENLIKSSIYYAVRHCIDAGWLNDRDQFLQPNEQWEADFEFQGDCLSFTLFNTNIQSQNGINHWIPYNEYEVNAKEKFESNFMYQFIHGKFKSEVSADLFGRKAPGTEAQIFSSAGKAVLDAGRELWKYYHKQPNGNVNASFYDIREHFQGRKEDGKMNSRSDDAEYTLLVGNLRDKLKVLAKKIEPKVYEYGFLKG
jgi:hypothetical protein